MLGLGHGGGDESREQQRRERPPGLRLVRVRVRVRVRVLVRTARKRLVRVARTYSTEAPRGVRVSTARPPHCCGVVAAASAASTLLGVALMLGMALLGMAGGRTPLRIAPRDCPRRAGLCGDGEASSRLFSSCHDTRFCMTNRKPIG